MTKFVPPGFDANAVTAGLYKAMGFGEPNQTDDKATFYIETTSDMPESVPVDAQGVPFDTTKKRPKNFRAVRDVNCAIDYGDISTNAEPFGQIQPTKIEVTLLDPDYQLVKGFSYVVAGGDRYYYSKTQPPIALGSIDVWIIICTAQDER